MSDHQRLVATAPVRIADIGGWTDTWYARHGRVCHIAVEPGAHVTVDWLADDAEADDTVRLIVGSDSYRFVPGRGPGVHPLIEAVVAGVPPPAGVELTVGADVPPGSGLGTSAAVVVALLAALRAARREDVDAAALAAQAHRIETGLGWETGVQDQWAAAFGGIGDLDVHYPAVTRRSLSVTADTRQQLEHRLVTIYLGHPHSSSETHKTVIAHLGDVGESSPYGLLRRCAGDAADALRSGDLDAYGAALTLANEAMRGIDSLLISPAADELIEVARRHHAAGWKVNGAGGDGGTLTILGSGDAVKRALMAEELEASSRGHLISHRLASEGVVVRLATGGGAT